MKTTAWVVIVALIAAAVVVVVWHANRSAPVRPVSPVLNPEPDAAPSPTAATPNPVLPPAPGAIYNFINDSIVKAQIDALQKVEDPPGTHVEFQEIFDGPSELHATFGAKAGDKAVTRNYLLAVRSKDEFEQASWCDFGTFESEILEVDPLTGAAKIHLKQTAPGKLNFEAGEAGGMNLNIGEQVYTRFPDGTIKPETPLVAESQGYTATTERPAFSAGQLRFPDRRVKPGEQWSFPLNPDLGDKSDVAHYQFDGYFNVNGHKCMKISEVTVTRSQSTVNDPEGKSYEIVVNSSIKGCHYFDYENQRVLRRDLATAIEVDGNHPQLDIIRDSLRKQYRQVSITE